MRKAILLCACLVSVPVSGALAAELNPVGPPITDEVLRRARPVVVSPDDRNVYVGSAHQGGALVTYDKLQDGTLAWKETLTSVEVPGLRYPWDLQMASGGEHLYLSGTGENRIFSFSRNAESGDLDLVDVESISGGLAALVSAYSLALSPDENFLYAGYADTRAIHIFRRDMETGQLEPQSQFKPENYGPLPYKLRMSADGAVLFSSNGGSGIYALRRNQDNGELSLLNWFRPSYLECLDAIPSVDGKNVYVVEGNHGIGDRGAIRTYFRDQNDSFTIVQTLVKGTELPNLYQPFLLEFAPDGDHLALGDVQGGVTILLRDEETGLLQRVAEVSGEALTEFELYGINDIAWDHMGNYLYVTGYHGHLAVLKFEPESETPLAIISHTLGGAPNSADDLNDVAWLLPDMANEALYTANAEEMTRIHQFTVAPHAGLEHNGDIIDSGYSPSSLALDPGLGVLYVGLDAYFEGIRAYKRDSVTGDFSLIDSVTTDDQYVAPDYNSEYAVFSHVAHLALTEDGKHLYGLSRERDAVLILDRNGDGTLQNPRSFRNGTNGCANMVSPVQLAIAPDEKDLYVAAVEGNSITWFSRNAEDGSLTYRGVIPALVAQGLVGVHAITISSDGRNIYTGSSLEPGIACFSRADDGSLTLLEQFLGISSTCGKQIAMRGDGTRLYIPYSSANTVGSLRRNPRTGRLSVAGTVSDEDIGRLREPRCVALSPDGKLLFVYSAKSSNVRMFSTQAGSQELWQVH